MASYRTLVSLSSGSVVLGGLFPPWDLPGSWGIIYADEVQDLISLISFYLLVAIHLLSRVFLLSVLLVLFSWSTLASCQVSGLVPANLMASVLAVARGPLPPAVARRVAKSVGPSSVEPSSTTTHSETGWLWPPTEANASPIHEPALNMGITTLTDP